ncbi:hypothetical protein F511_41001 [Dorcoceras hygrometricum]|uniref:Uncharacterized protein n=1 Tax=Dorcoceras hygrometricum TaxID=472368 RepID=A0A2Z7A7G3_9LAMI|nr:hypothetical protein F511_41001 [Dorcoceras hygrometricum]
MQRRCDQQPVIALDLPAPATMAGALLAGPPPGPGGSNVTNHVPNRALAKENDPYKEGARRCAEARSAWCSPSSRWFDLSHIWATPSLPQDPLEPPNGEPRSLRKPLNRSHSRKIRNREMQRVRIHEHDHMSKDLKHSHKSHA